MSTRRILVLAIFLSCLSIFPQSLFGQTSWLRSSEYPLAAPPWIEPSVVYDSARGAFVMWYVDNKKNVIGRSISFDGVSWFVADTIALSAGGEGAFDQHLHAVHVLFLSETYLMFYTASGSDGKLVIGAARSSDGIRWEKVGTGPVLQPEAGAWDSRHVADSKVVLMNGTLKMWYTGTDGTIASTGLATSTDGIVWTRHPSNPVLMHGPSSSFDEIEASVKGVVEKEGMLYMVYRGIALTGVHSYALATSSDGVSWWKYSQNPIMVRSALDNRLGGGALLWCEPWFRFWYASADIYDDWTIRAAVSEAVVLSLEDAAPALPGATDLGQNYPNPFNPSTMIPVRLAKEDHLSLSVYDLLGRKIADLINERRPAGEFDVKFDGSHVPSGMYLYRLQVGNQVSTRRMVLVK